MDKIMHIGLDDTDSTKHGCTTYLAALLVEQLERLNVKFIDYPRLVRLNPNVPWKTRGNGALCLRFQFDDALTAEIKALTVKLVEEKADTDVKGTDPGIVFFEKREVPDEFKTFAKKTETDIVTLKEATALIGRFGAEAVGFNTCRGIIGALAAIGETLEGDHTFELIAYRTEANRGSKRRVVEASIFEMDKLTQPYTFNNVDYEKRRVIITPRGPDPILLGIRGETLEIVRKAFAMVKPLEQVERWMIFRTNQGTDAHLTRAATLSEIKPHQSIIAKGAVSRKPQVVPVRHVIFALKDTTAEVDCAAYEPTGDLRKVAQELLEGDQLEVYGAVRRPHNGNPLTLNLEKISIQALASKIAYRNPMCPSCGKSSESMGRAQGFRCKKCGTRFKAEKIDIVEPRRVSTALHFASTRSQRHLTKPLRRYGHEKNRRETENMLPDWHS
jgi:tRNA(Ile2)-agmatinylcytidine synthase